MNTIFNAVSYFVPEYIEFCNFTDLPHSTSMNRKSNMIDTITRGRILQMPHFAVSFFGGEEMKNKLILHIL